MYTEPGLPAVNWWYGPPPPSTVYGTIHYGKSINSSSSKQFDLPLSSFDGGYHTIGLEWNEKDIKWMIDGIIYFKNYFGCQSI